MNLLRAACSVGPLRRLLKSSFATRTDPGKTVFGLSFRNPVGLGAGFDKNAKYLRELDTLGFGFVEIGTVTPLPQAGNDKPRLFRLPKDGALINRMGFNNEGVDAVARRLQKWKASVTTAFPGKGEPNSPSLKGADSGFLIGGNIGKNKSTPNEEAWRDYEICFRKLHPHVDFFVVNVSSPNTPGLRALQEKDALHRILTGLQAINRELEIQRPILLKIAPDLTATQLDEVADLALEIGLDGLVASNTTISRDGLATTAEKVAEIGAGGLSGKPLRARATEVLEHLVTRTRGRIPVIGSGGIFTAPDAKEKLAAGATLLEVWTGFIYEGPGITRKIGDAL